MMTSRHLRLRYNIFVYIILQIEWAIIVKTSSNEELLLTVALVDFNVSTQRR